MSKFAFKIIEEPNFVNVLLDGPMNESFSSFDLKIPKEKSVRFDFARISSINSVGIRHWIVWLQNNPGLLCHFKNCPVCIVDQMNNVSDFMPSNTTVESFFVPYYSEHTGEEKHELYVLKRDFQKGKDPAIRKLKDSKGNDMELDIYPQKYFKFLKK